MQLPRVPASGLMKEGAAGHRLVLGLLGLLLCYPGLWQTILGPQNGGDQAAGPGGGAATSSQLAEVQLQPFAGDSEKDLEELVLPREEEEEDGNTSCSAQTCASPARAADEEIPAEPEAAEGIVAGHVKRVRWGHKTEVPSKVADREVKTEAVEASWSNVTAWAQGVEALQADLQRRMAALPSQRGNFGGEGALLQEIMDAGRELCLEPQRRGRPSCERFLRPGDHKRMLQADLQEIQAERQRWEVAFVDRADDFARELCLDPRREGMAACKRFLPKAKQEEQPPLLQRILDLGSELCADPRRRSRPSCVEFLPAARLAREEAAFGQAVEEARAASQAWEKSFVDEAVAFGRQLCLEPQREGYEACKQFLEPPAEEGSITDEIFAFGRELCLEPQREGYEACSQFLEPPAEEKPLLEKIMDLGHEMCLQPHRRGRPGCTQFLNRTAEFDKLFEKIREDERVWDQAFAERLAMTSRELCAEPQRRSSEACKRLLA